MNPPNETTAQATRTEKESSCGAATAFPRQENVTKERELRNEDVWPWSALSLLEDRFRLEKMRNTTVPMVAMASPSPAQPPGRRGPE